MRPKNLPGVRKLSVRVHTVGAKKIEIGKSRTKLPTFQSNLRSSTLSVKIMYDAVGGRALYGDTKHFRNISAFYLQINVRCYM